MNGLPYLFRWGAAAGLLLGFAASALLCLGVGMVLGEAFVRTGSSLTGAALTTARLPEALSRNAVGILSILPLVVAVLAAMHGGLPGWLARFTTNVVRFVRECLKFPAREHSWFGGPANPGLAPSFAGSCLPLIVAAFLLGSYGARSAEPSRPPVTYVFFSDSMLSVLPIHPLVHFENAGIDAARELTGRGTTLDDARRAALKRFVDALRPCARPVAIRPYGFASDDPFAGVDQAESDRLNFEVANRRAQAVREELEALVKGGLAESGMTVEAEIKWTGFEQMKKERDTMIRVPAGSARHPPADRVAMLRVTVAGVCGAAEPDGNGN